MPYVRVNLTFGATRRLTATCCRGRRRRVVARWESSHPRGPMKDTAAPEQRSRCRNTERGAEPRRHPIFVQNSVNTNAAPKPTRGRGENRAVDRAPFQAGIFVLPLSRPRNFDPFRGPAPGWRTGRPGGRELRRPYSEPVRFSAQHCRLRSSRGRQPRCCRIHLRRLRS